MTDTDTSPDVLTGIGQRIDAAYERTKIGRQEWIDGTIELAFAFAEAKEQFPSTIAFKVWIAETNRDYVSHQDRAALIHMAQPDAIEMTRKVLSETTRISWRLIWEEEIMPRLTSAGNSTPKPESIPESAQKPVIAPKNEKPVITETEKPASSHNVPKKTKMQERYGEDVAKVLYSRFKHARRFNTQFGSDKPGVVNKEKTIMRYLAERCTKPDYPVELFEVEAWTTQLLYPHLPQKLLDMVASGPLSKLIEHHTKLIATEAKFVLTPEFGNRIAAPFVAFNKANTLFHDIKSGHVATPVDPAATHKTALGNDEGKPPIVVRGVQLWPAESNCGYGYDDLRCAYGLAKDVLITFGEPKDAPMSVKSLKLRHLMAWLPPNGYNSSGASLDGTMRALTVVVQAYGTDKNDTMHAPLPSLIKLGD